MARPRKPQQGAAPSYKAGHNINVVGGDQIKAGGDVIKAHRDITFGAVQSSGDLATQLERLRAELAAARETGKLGEEVATDAEYHVTKAAQQAKKDHPDKNVILEYLGKAKTLVEGVTASTGLVTSLASAIEAVHKLFS